MKNKTLFSNIIIGFFAILIIVIAFSLSYFKIFDIYELPLLDLRFQLRPTPVINDKIVFIEIADDCIKQKGWSWPFPRQRHAFLIKALRSSKVKSIFFDMFFSEKKEGDQELAQEMMLEGNVYVPSVFSVDIGTKMDFPLADEYDAELLDIFSGVVKGTGHINIIPDKDGKFRRIPPFIRFNEKYVPQLGFLMALDLIGEETDDIHIEKGKYLKFNNGLKIPLDERSNVIVNFPGKWVDTFRHYSYLDIIRSYEAELTGKKGIIDLSELEGSVCYIGMSSTAAEDVHPSPYESLYPGMGVHASLYNSIVNKAFIFRISKTINILILVLMLFCVYFCVQFVKKRYSIFVFIIIISGFCLLCFLVFICCGAWIDIFCPLFVATIFYIVMIFVKYLMEIKQRELLEKELSIAKKIQESFLPSHIPNVKDLDIAVNMITAKQVGGDLYDFVKFQDDKIGVMIGDVSGKGVPASLYMAKAVSLFKQLLNEKDPQCTLKKLNEILSEETSSNLFVTMSFAIFDLKNKKVSFSSGGHSPIMVCRKTEKNIMTLENSDGLPLGIMSCDFDKKEASVEKGDIYVFYTDGVTEAMNKKGKCLKMGDCQILFLRIGKKMRRKY